MGSNKFLLALLAGTLFVSPVQKNDAAPGWLTYLKYEKMKSVRTSRIRDVMLPPK